MIAVIVEIAERIQPCNVRAIAYQLFNHKLIPSMGKKHVAAVSRLATIAREEGSLPWEWIVDPTRQEEAVATWSDPAGYARTVQRSYRRDKWQDQPKHVSVWSEKATVAGTLKPILDKYEVPFQVLHGWSGATPIRDAAQGNLCRSQDTLILYVGDFDPSGMGMSELDLPRRLVRYSQNDPTDRSLTTEQAREYLRGHLRLDIRRIALTPTQVKAMGPKSRFPASDKSTDSRHDWFVANYGDWCWELDAMSPNSLRECVEQAILAELDREVWNRYVRVEEVERQAIIDTCATWNSILRQDQEYS
jgi:hypothetical protein